MGTVGAVAVDIHGNVASATSTGGMLNKMEGRVGDTPCVGRCTAPRSMWNLTAVHNTCTRVMTFLMVDILKEKMFNVEKNHQRT